MKIPIHFYRHNFSIILIFILAILLWYAFHGDNLLVDDSFISFNYAKNLVEGNGIVWSPGERVEGYTNFLWVMLFAFGLKIGVQPEIFTYVISIPIYLAGLFLVYLLALKILKSRTLSLVVLLLVGFNHSIAGFAGSGMETPLQMLEFVLVGYILWLGFTNGWNTKRTLFFSIVLCLSLLTRPDAIILVGWAITGWFFSNRNRKISDLIPLVAPFILLILPWLIWKQIYYGSIIPNSFNVKVQGFDGFGYGFYYLFLFSVFFGLFPFLIIVAGKGKSLVLHNRIAGYLAILILLWLVYIVWVGGDFMEFRFLVPVIPFIFIVIISTLTEFIKDRYISTALIIALCIGTVSSFYFVNRKYHHYRVERVEELRDHLYAPAENWAEIGKLMGQLFDGTDVTIAVGAAGVIPYYSRLESVDFLGLNDKVIPQIGEVFTNIPGHLIIAPLEYIVNRNVNLVIQPIRLMFNRETFFNWARVANWNDIYRFYLDIDKPVNNKQINEATLVCIPIKQGYTLVVWYLTPHEAIDNVIQEYGLRKIYLSRK
ncbi:MAG: hypothetical protein P9X24_04350 [Candidatus Hatepunaea meridiana]|nr:hypothetical protein [Candidatus Hatepunaea meridiana]